MFDELEGGDWIVDPAGIDPRPGWCGPLWIPEDDLEHPMPRPMWRLEAGQPTPVPELPSEFHAEAWEHAAVWTQQELDEVEREFRVLDVRRTERLLVAYRTAMADIVTRYGSELARRDGQGARVFFAQTAAALGMRAGQVAHRIDSADTLQTRLPATWARYVALEATWTAVDLAVAQAEGLDPERWAAYDEQAAVAVASTSLSSLKRKLARIRERVQQDTADARAKATLERRRVTVEPGHDGEGHLTLSGPIVEIAAMGGAIRRAAVAAHGHPDETRTIAQLQYDIARDLIIDGIQTPARPDSDVTVPQRKGIVPTVTVTVPVLTLLGKSNEHGILEGYGPIAPETARMLAASAPSFTRLLTHPVTGVRLDLDRTTYAPPADLRRWVTLRDQVCRFPGCDRPASSCDVDHAIERQDSGVTAAANLVTLCRTHHNAKSTRLATERLQPDDDVEWETPLGTHPQRPTTRPPPTRTPGTPRRGLSLLNTPAPHGEVSTSSTGGG